MTRTPIHLAAANFDYAYQDRFKEELKALRTTRYRRVGLWFGVRPEYYVTPTALEALGRVIADGDAAAEAADWSPEARDQWWVTTGAAIGALCDEACPDLMGQVPDSARTCFVEGVAEAWDLRALGLLITEGSLVVGPIHAPLYSCQAEFTKDALAALAGLHAADPHLVLHKYCAGDWLGASLEFETRLSLAEVAQVFTDVENSSDGSRKGIDLHVMRETLRATPLQGNSLERTFLDKPEALVTEVERRGHEERLAKLDAPAVAKHTWDEIYAQLLRNARALCDDPDNPTCLVNLRLTLEYLNATEPKWRSRPKTPRRRRVGR